MKASSSSSPVDVAKPSVWMTIANPRLSEDDESRLTDSLAGGGVPVNIWRVQRQAPASMAAYPIVETVQAVAQNRRSDAGLGYGSTSTTMSGKPANWLSL